MPPARLSYLQIADDLEARINSGEYRPGDQLPSYAQVAAMYSVSVTTAQSAYRILRDRGLTETRLGFGIFVIDDSEDG
jgi:GntR family transcriptional regulator